MRFRFVVVGTTGALLVSVLAGCMDVARRDVELERLASRFS